ncbi:MAG: FkbM family methyltransferase [Nitrospinaceae bacterium]|nr:FkbM family methyltransferase [Nitrospinaceae bacterium]MBT6395738.1 FkbM family methyltransferase [Nitrospinaceae bacterium]
MKPDMTVYDIGAQAGYYSCIFSRLAHRGKIFSFEPLPENIISILRHIRMNKLSNVQVVHTALAGESGISGFSVEGEKHRNILIPTENAPLLIPTISLDDAVEIHQFPLPDFLKIDVEGAENQVLQGAQRTIEKVHPTIFLALHGEDQKNQCFQFLQMNNYALYDLEDRELTAPGETDEIRAT